MSAAGHRDAPDPPDAGLAWEAGPGAGLRALPRLGLVLGSSALLLLGSPGAPLDGPLLAPLAVVLGLALWALAAARVGPWRKRLDWLGGFLYGSILMSWVGYVTPPSVVWIGIGWGLYQLLAGVLMRRLLHHVGLPLAVASCFTMQESLRTLIPTPIGISWIRVGHALDELAPLRAAAGTVGVVGLGFFLAALGGLVALVLLRATVPAGPPWARVRAREMGRPPIVQAAAVGLLTLVLLALGATRPALGLDEPDGAYARGPRALLVQPGLTQERKRELNAGTSVAELLDRQLALTLDGLLAEDAAGRRVDLVAWGETMLPLELAHPDLAAAVADGVALDWPSWDPLGARALERKDGAARVVQRMQLGERNLLTALRRGRFLLPTGEAAADWLAAPADLARASALFAGSHFAAGTLAYTVRAGVVRRTNAVALWDPAGELRGTGYKRHLVPGAESALGLEEYAWARAWAAKLMPYVPDMRAANEVGRLPAADGAWSAGAAVCFDNGFEDLFLESARDGNDFVLLASNEAWYVRSHEFDQMLALSRLWAVESGRSIVRATNSGVSCQVAPDGSIPDRLVVDGEDRAVAGVLALDVVVPREGTAPAPYTRLRGWVEGLALLLPWLLLALFELLDGRREVAERSDSAASVG